VLAQSGHDAADSPSSQIPLKLHPRAQSLWQLNWFSNASQIPSTTQVKPQSVGQDIWLSQDSQNPFKLHAVGLHSAGQV
jgi:hypothetical protein